MKVSELIEYLEYMQNVKGDVEVRVCDTLCGDELNRLVIGVVCGPNTIELVMRSNKVRDGRFDK